MNKKSVLKEITDMMAYHSRVAKVTVWFSYGQIWDIMRKAEAFQKRSMTRSFPTRQEFATHVSKHPNLMTKIITEKELFQDKITRNKRQQYYAYESTFEQPRPIYMREVATK